MERFGRQVGPVRPDHRTSDRIEQHPPEIGWLLNQLEHWSPEKRKEVDRFLHPIIEKEPQAVGTGHPNLIHFFNPGQRDRDPL